MSEKTKLIARLVEEKRMSDLYREFSISWKTGFKIKKSLLYTYILIYIILYIFKP